jgi:ABC-type phosphate/phosphonate transport system substrate-binding protein
MTAFTTTNASEHCIDEQHIYKWYTETLERHFNLLKRDLMPLLKKQIKESFKQTSQESARKITDNFFKNAGVTDHTIKNFDEAPGYSQRLRIPLLEAIGCMLEKTNRK